MKNLILIRHGKSSWEDPGVADRERTLNKRGLKDAATIGGALRDRGVKPDVIIVSLAVRAWTTAELIADELEYPREELMQESAIYAAGLGALMDVVRNIDEDVECACLIGHNPGFEDLANRLIPEMKIDHMPTCGVVRMQLNSDTWGAVGEGDGELLEFFGPKTLA
ncbi:MAG: histidine phosphatase family protein [Verrucomicrobiales bacterium]|nr:histidine phosphatase family protein [Verrucomicrobiales bacterium]